MNGLISHKTKQIFRSSFFFPSSSSLSTKQHASGYSPPAYPSYHPHDSYAGFYAGTGGMQSGLSSEGFYSTYSGPPADTEGGERESRPAHGTLGDSGSESDGGPTF